MNPIGHPSDRERRQNRLDQPRTMSTGSEETFHGWGRHQDLILDIVIISYRDSFRYTMLADSSRKIHRPCPLDLSLRLAAAMKPQSESKTSSFPRPIFVSAPWAQVSPLFGSRQAHHTELRLAISGIQTRLSSSSWTMTQYEFARALFRHSRRPRVIVHFHPASELLGSLPRHAGRFLDRLDAANLFSSPRFAWFLIVFVGPQFAFHPTSFDQLLESAQCSPDWLPFVNSHSQSHSDSLRKSSIG
jgi:hypothetical protein